MHTAHTEGNVQSVLTSMYQHRHDLQRRPPPRVTPVLYGTVPGLKGTRGPDGQSFLIVEGQPRKGRWLNTLNTLLVN